MSKKAATAVPSASGPFVVQLDLPGPRVAVCPTCGDFITSPAIHFVYGYAFCRDCAGLPRRTTYELMSILSSPTFTDHVRVHRGLVFYVPRSLDPRPAFEQWAYDAIHAP